MSHSRDEESDKDLDLDRSHVDLSRMMLQGRSFSGLERHCTFLNTGGFAGGRGRFATVSGVSGLDYPDDGRALAVVDWDHDGDLDLWLSARNAPRIRLMHNQTATKNHFLVLGLKGNGSTTNRDGIGARVEVVFKGKNTEKSLQTLRAGEGFLSQDSKWLHFGLGEKEEIDHVLVSWPGGRMEKFDDLMVNRRYLLVQGGNKAIETARRDAGQFVFQASAPVLPAPAAQARIPLMTPMPVAALPIRNYLGKEQQVKPGVGGPVLVTLWASWCSTCKAELTEFSQRAEDLQKAGIGVLALSVDGLGDERSDPATGKKLLDDLQFPFPVGFATRELVQMFQEIHDSLIPLKLPLPVPTSFLIDQGGQVSVIYKGRVKVDDLIRDSTRVSGETGFDLGDIAPLPGRTIKDKNLEEVFRQNRLLTLFQRGVSLADNNRHGEAVSYYLKALELQPASYKIHYNLGLAYYRSNSIDSAVHHIGRAIELQPQFLLSHKVMGELQLLLGNNDRAKEHYRQYLQGVPEDVEAINAQAVIATGTGDLAGAEESLQRAIDLNPTYVEARYNLGTILLMQRRMKEAEDTFLRILTIEPHYTDVLYNLGYLAELSGDSHRAANLYTGELRNHPASVKALSGLARIMEKHGDYSQAKNYYAQALALRPDYTPAQEGLKRIGQQIGQGQ